MNTPDIIVEFVTSGPDITVEFPLVISVGGGTGGTNEPLNQQTVVCDDGSVWRVRWERVGDVPQPYWERIS